MNSQSDEAQREKQKQKPKPPMPLRLWKSFRRRRVWLKIGEHPKANVAEKITVFITGCILLVGAVQAFIYWQQTNVMKATLGQNERAIMLNTGQLAVAAQQASLLRHQIAGSEAAVVAIHISADPDNGLMLKLINQGHVLSPKVVVKMTTYGIRKQGIPFADDIAQFRPVQTWESDPWSGSSVRYERLAIIPENIWADLKSPTSRRTIKTEGIISYDNGFDRVIEMPFCFVSYYGQPFTFPNGQRWGYEAQPNMLDCRDLEIASTNYRRMRKQAAKATEHP